MKHIYDPDRDGERLSAYLDDALSDDERADVETLLSISDVARRDLQALKDTQNLFQNWDPVRPDPFFLRRVEARLDAENGVPIASRWALFYPKIAMAVLFLMTFGGLAWLSQIKDADEPVFHVEAFDNGVKETDVERVAYMAEVDVSRDVVLDIVLSENVR